jgi:hypothetical protein
MMGGTRTATTLEIKELKRALKQGDATTLGSLYAEDAEMTVMDCSARQTRR